MDSRTPPRARVSVEEPWPLATLTLDWTGATGGHRSMLAYLHRVVAWLEDRSSGRLWQIRIDGHRPVVEIHAVKSERAHALRLLEELAVVINARVGGVVADVSSSRTPADPE